ncbi:unnamed protein product [Camellia sinensis]
MFVDAKPNGKELIVVISREVLDAAAHVIQPGMTTDEIDEVVHEATIAFGGYPSIRDLCQVLVLAQMQLLLLSL